MPKASKFAALGAGNGFPSCLAFRDVSSFSVRPLTLEQAMKCYWLLSELKCTASSELNAATANPPFNISTSIANIPLEEPDPDGQPNGKVRKPHERACGGSFGFFDPIYSEQTNGLSRVRIEVRCFPSIQRLYNGSVFDENNFIGYGFRGGGGSPFSIICHAAGYGGGSALMQIASYQEPFSDSVIFRDDIRTITLDVDGEDIDFMMRQRGVLHGRDGGLTSHSFTFTDNGCDIRSVFTLQPSVTSAHFKINVTGLDAFTFN
mgnify:CR=1 FL=1